MTISNELRDKFINREGSKLIKLVIPERGLTITNENIYADTLKITESIMNSSNLEFVGCISSSMEIELHGITHDLKGLYIKAYITVEDYEEEYIPIFTGYVDSVKTRISDSWKSITCYDFLYAKASDKDIAGWYNGLSFPLTIRQFRNSLFDYIGLPQQETWLVNDNIDINKEYEPTTLNALDVIKNICQFNGVCGIIGRTGQFEYRKYSGAEARFAGYPSRITHPSGDMFPSHNSIDSGMFPSIMIPFYEDMEYEDYKVNKITKVLLRNTEDDEGISSGTGANTYIVQGNIFAYGLSEENLTLAASNILRNISGFEYRPFDSKSIGLPFVECGSLVTFYTEDYLTGQGHLVLRSFYIMTRSMNGIQNIKDSYSAQGEQNQRVFVSDLNVKIDLVKKEEEGSEEIDELKESVNDLDKRVKDLEEGGTGDIKVLSVNSIPTNPQKNIVYLVQGELVRIE